MCQFGGHIRKLCDKDCDHCFAKSFASNPVSKIWHTEKNGGVTPRQVFRSSNTKRWFKCDKWLHSFDMNINNIDKYQKTLDDVCPYCHGHRLCGVEQCATCFKHSFASHPAAKYWSDKNDVKPQQIMRCSMDKRYFNCPCGHEILVPIVHDRTEIN